ncbi:MAG: YlmC/YmxH family sporulation protein [Clostridia bacterium]|nr:YlmC/YmxH family sporulation protein [Clostridia bacterium]
MNSKGLDFKHKEVINITNAQRLGYVMDVNAELGTGVITSIVVPGNTRFLNLFSGDTSIVIPWDKIKAIGDDLILVEI